MAKKTKETEQVQIDVKKTDEYQKLLSELERVKKELAAERSRGSIIEEAKAVASATGEMRYRGHFVPAIYNRNITQALGMVMAVRMMEVLDALYELPAEITRMMRDALKEQVGHIVREVLAELDYTPKAEGTD